MSLVSFIKFRPHFGDSGSSTQYFIMRSQDPVTIHKSLIGSLDFEISLASCLVIFGDICDASALVSAWPMIFWGLSLSRLAMTLHLFDELLPMSKETVG